MKRKLALAALLILAPTAADASCSVTATGVAFGTYVPSAASNSTGTVTVSCSALVGLLFSWTIALNAGVNSGGSFSNRRMASGSSYLSYQLYTNSGHTTVWGDGTGGTSTVPGSCLISLLGLLHCSGSATVYGQIPALQNPSPGSYTDTITVTITY
ncbi:spore coat protein U domain-containing protein [Acidithiobacillus sp. 'AMD consortium']|uniref:Csu type fimbrial protein n=1 Tax=Acidithiobacillus sp. 'AMD consortium' TaxID=2614801 RepID=UPI00124D26F7|nr:spore coat U domain-containing protein [Acidithiobacillus sp. 'AMD consortium']QFG77200.1 spore coat protein U domain-containing protein [Acidithiobacillus sp. 'AMD consortium']